MTPVVYDKACMWDNVFLSFPSHGSIHATHTVHDVDSKNTEYVSLQKLKPSFPLADEHKGTRRVDVQISARFAHTTIPCNELLTYQKPRSH